MDEKVLDDAHNALAEAQREGYYRAVHGTRAPTQEEEEAAEHAKQLATTRTPRRPSIGGGASSPTLSSRGTPLSARRRTLSIGSGPLDRDEKFAVKQQLERNAKVRAAALEIAEGLISMAEGIVSSINAKVPQAANRLTQSHDAVLEVDDVVKWRSSTGWDAASVCKAAELALGPEEIAKLVGKGVPDAIPVLGALRELSNGEKLTKSRLVQRHSTLDVRDAFAPIEVAAPAVALHELLHADVLAHVTHEIRRSDTLRLKLRKRAEEAQETRVRALKLGDVLEAERQHIDLIDTHEQLIEMLNERMAQLLMSSTEADGFGAQLARLRDDSKAAFTAFADRNSSLLAKVEADLKRSVRAREEQLSAHAAAVAKYAEDVKASLAALRSNANQQNDTLQEMAALAKKLQGLAETRKDLVANHISLKETEEKRLASHAKFLDIQGALHGDLETLRDQTRACAAMSDALLDFGKAMGQKLDVRDVSKELESLALKEGRAYLDELRDYVFVVGDLLTRRQHRADTLERQQRLAKLQHQSAVDALDPAIARYATELDALASNMATCQASIAQLQSQLTTAAAKFAPTEELLREHHVEFTHPVVEFTVDAVSKRRDFVERTMRFIEGEEAELDKKRTTLASMRVAAIENSVVVPTAAASVAAPSPSKQE